MELNFPRYKKPLGVLLLLKIVMGLSVGIIVGTLFYLISEIVSIKSQKYTPLIKDRIKLNKANVIALIVMVGVFIWLRNIVPALIAAIIVVYLPYQITYTRQKRLRNMALEQLSSATTLFANTFIVTKNIPRAIEVVGKRTPDPVGKIFRSAYSELTFGVPLETVSERLAKRLGVSYGYVFASLLKSAQKQGDVVAPLFRDLSYKITAAQEQVNFQNSEISSVRATNIFLLILPVPTFIYLSLKFPEMSTFATSTAGRILFTIWLLAIVIWMFMDRLVVDS